MKGSAIFRIIILSLGVIMMLYYGVLWTIRFFKGQSPADGMTTDLIAFSVSIVMVIWMIWTGRKNRKK